jgi:hypothetical protein
MKAPIVWLCIPSDAGVLLKVERQEGQFILHLEVPSGVVLNIIENDRKKKVVV